MLPACRSAHVLLAGLLVATLLPGVAPAHAAPADEVPPETITVCRDNYGGGEVATVPFDDYVREVLPYEFGGSGPAAYLEAGTVAVASYAWYHVEHPYSSRCHLTDGGTHQHYRPGAGFRTSQSDAAVDSIWHLRMTEVRNGSETPAYAQYCSTSCASFPPGEHLNQPEARDQAADGWSALDILRHHYRDKDGLDVRDWRAGFGLTLQGRSPVASDADPFELAARVDGASAGDDRAGGRLLVRCTIGGQWGEHRVGSSDVTSGDDGPELRFDGTPIRDCEEHEVGATLRLHVNGYPVAAVGVAVWDPWRSASERDTTRIAETSDPSAGSVAISRELFVDSPDGSASGDLTGSDDADGREARAVVIARSDRFADAMSAAGLAGRDAPILLNPGGGAPLRDDLADEIERILPEGATVHIVGGPEAVSEDVEDDPRLDPYEVVRHWGATRIDTSLAVAAAIGDRGGDPSVALVARAFPDTTAGWADAVTAGGFAAAGGHPTLLTATDRLHPDVEAWIEDGSNGVGEAVLLGGTHAVPADAEERLDVATTRVAGWTRDGTAVAIAEELWTRGDAPDLGGAMIVDTWNDDAWAFTLAGAVYAANHGTPGLATLHLVPRHTTGAWLDEHPGLPGVFVGDGSIVADRVERDVAGG